MKLVVFVSLQLGGKFLMTSLLILFIGFFNVFASRYGSSKRPKCVKEEVGLKIEEMPQKHSQALLQDDKELLGGRRKDKLHFYLSQNAFSDFGH